MARPMARVRYGVVGLGRVVGVDGVGLGQGHIGHTERHGSVAPLFDGPIGNTEDDAAGAPPSGIFASIIRCKKW